MSLWILDTDHVSLFQRGHPEIVERVTQTPPAEIAITIVTVEEMMRGWLAVIRRAQAVEAVGKGYTQLGKTIAFFNTIQVINFDLAAQRVYAALRSPPVRIGTQDLRIAAIGHSAKLKPSVQSGVGVAYKMTIISFDVPPEVFSALKASPDGFARELRLAAAIFWYQRGQMSQEKAAQIAGLDRTDFLMALAREQVDAFQVDFDDLERELARG